MIEKLLRIKEAAAITGEDVQTMYRRIREGEIMAVKIGTKGLRISEETLKKWIGGYEDFQR